MCFSSALCCAITHTSSEVGILRISRRVPLTCCITHISLHEHHSWSWWVSLEMNEVAQNLLFSGPFSLKMISNLTPKSGSFDQCEYKHTGLRHSLWTVPKSVWIGGCKYSGTVCRRCGSNHAKARKWAAMWLIVKCDGLGYSRVATVIKFPHQLTNSWHHLKSPVHQLSTWKNHHAGQISILSLLYGTVYVRKYTWARKIAARTFCIFILHFCITPVWNNFKVEYWNTHNDL